MASSIYIANDGGGVRRDLITPAIVDWLANFDDPESQGRDVIGDSKQIDFLSQIEFAMAQVIRQMESLQKLSDDYHGAPVLSTRFAGGGSTWGKLKNVTLPRNELESEFVLRYSIERLGHRLPTPTTLDEALRLRTAPAMKSYRRLLHEFHDRLAQGDLVAVSHLERELHKAERVLGRLTTLTAVSTWTTYASLPVGTLEALTYHVPLAGSALSVLGIGSTCAASALHRRYGWMLATP